MGDFNYPRIDWNNLSSDRQGEEFLNVVQDCCFVQHVLEATRENNILDLVLTSEENVIEDLKILEPIGNSDHNTVVWKFLCSNLMYESQDKSKLNKLDFKHANYVNINRILSAVDWDDEFEGKDIDSQWKSFCEILLSACDGNAPLKKFRNKMQPKWFNAEAKRSQERKYAMFIRYREIGDYESEQEYKFARNNCNEVYRRAKKNFEEKLAKNVTSDTKSFYSYVRSKSKVKDAVGPLANPNGELVTEKSEMCNILNNYFGSVFTNEDNLGELPPITQLFDGQALDKIVIDSEIVYTKLRNLKPDKAPGIDGLASQLLIETSEEICYPLSKIYEKSLMTGCIPVDWKLSNVTPIYKGGKRSEPGNYRPVSLTPHVCKVLESILKDSMLEHLIENDMLKGSQHGFVSKRSCFTNLLSFFEKVNGWVDEGEAVDVIYLDFRKAFDTVPHKRLMQKIKACGISGLVYDWIESWLVGRRQRVTLGANQSDWVEVISGVPQGSVLGPLFFLIFINDIDEDLINLILKFADDTKLFGKVGNVAQLESMHRDLELLNKWSKTWGLEFNVDKCKVIHFGRNNPNATYAISDKNLKEVKEEKDLGVIVNQDLKAANQCAVAVKAANRTLGLIKRTFSSRSKDIILGLYKSLVRPKLEYCMSVWKPHYRKDIDLLEGVQRRSLKVIDGFNVLCYEDRLSAVHLTSLETRRIRGDLIEVYKIMHGLTNLNPEDFFTFATSELRGHKYKLYKPRIKTDIGKFSFSFRVIDLWNSLPDEVVNAGSVNSFKNKIDDVIKFGWGLK